MHPPASLLIAGSALILLVLGAAHLWLTFRSSAFLPRDAALRAQLDTVSPSITGQTTMARAAIGFHASHSAGAVLFGLVYGYLALTQAQVLWASTFLLTVGLLFLAFLALLAYRHWFSTPLRGIILALGLYLAALVVHWA